MIDTFSKGVAQVAEAFFPRPIVYRFLDFKPDEFLELPGGEKYEKDHVGPNPLIGYRGQYRYMKEDSIFRLELKAIEEISARIIHACQIRNKHHSKRRNHISVAVYKKQDVTRP